MSRGVHLVDCTLREGDQTAGVAMTFDEKLEIAELLDAAGVPLVDAGMPAVHRNEARFLREAVKRCTSMTVGASVRCRPDMAQLALDCGVGAVFVICPVSDHHLSSRLDTTLDHLLDSLEEVAAIVRGHASLEVVAEDATRADESSLMALTKTAKRVGADRMYLADTVGVKSPAQWSQLVTDTLVALGDEVQLGVHCHNDYGMATALTVAAIEAGVCWPTATINGLGERAGNADLGAVAAATQNLLGLQCSVDLGRIQALSRSVERASETLLNEAHPLVGANAFRHESGIHVHGVLKDPSLYEAIDPAQLGRERTLLIGKHSGGAHLRAVLAKAGISLADEELERLRMRIQAACGARSRSEFDDLRRSIDAFRRTSQGVPTEKVIEWARELEVNP